MKLRILLMIVVVVVGSRCSSVYASSQVSDTLPIHITVYFKVQNKSILDSLVNAQQNPNSPNYHHWLKTGEFNERFGVTKSQNVLVSNFLKKAGFSIRKSTNRYLIIDGQAQHAVKAFGVHLIYQDKTHYAPDKIINIPETLKDIIGPITGLDNLNLPKPAQHTSAGNGIGPFDFYNMYSEPVSMSNGAGICIAIIAGSDIRDSAMTQFTGAVGIPNTTVIRRVDGVNPGPDNDGYENEAELDVEWSHSTAPGSSIHLYIGNVDIGVLAQDAADDNICSVINLSFAVGGEGGPLVAALNSAYEQANAQGQTVTAASGDFGSSSQYNNQTSVNGVASSPFATAVGGVTVDPPSCCSYGPPPDFIIPNHQPETVWQAEFISCDGLPCLASGGGQSSIYSKPSWQIGTPADNTRDLPDVAAPANTNMIYSTAITGSPVLSISGGGTSVSAPMWAGLLATLSQSIGQRLGNVNPLLYQAANKGIGFYNITSGNNQVAGGAPYYSANPLGGYNLCTGWGTPNFAQLLQFFQYSTVGLKGAGPF